jgi:hypothetical protein
MSNRLQPHANRCLAFATIIVVFLPGCDARNGAEQTQGDSPIAVVGGAFRVLGEITPGKFRSETFDIVNTGRAPIRLKEPVKTSCGCTSAKLSTTDLAPQGHAELTMTMLAPVIDTVDQRITALVRIDESGKTRQFTLGFSYNVRLPWGAVPKTLRISGGPKTIQDETILLHRAFDSKASVRSATAEGLPLQLTWSEFSDNKAELHVKCPMPDNVGIRHGTVSITTNDENVPVQTVRIECSVVRSVTVVPETVLFTILDCTAKAKQAVRLSSDRTFCIQSIRCKHQAVSWKNVTPSGGTTHMLEIVIDATAINPGMHQASVIVCISSGRESRSEEVEIPVMVVKETQSAMHPARSKGGS